MQNGMATLQLQSGTGCGTLTPTNTPGCPLVSTNEIRVENLRRLIRDSGGPSALAKRLGYSNASFLVQMAGPSPIRQVTEKTARNIESKLGLEPGALDSGIQRPDVALTVDVIRLVGRVLEEEGVALPPVRFAELVAFALTEKPSSDSMRQVVKLLRTEPR